MAYSSELATSTPYSTRLFNEPLTLERTGEASVTTTSALDSSVRYVTADHQGLVYVWRGAAEKADERMLPTHPTPEQTHTVETILDYGCDWKYIVENNLDTPHLYWLHDGSIPPIESLGCNRDNIGSIGLRAFRDDIGTGHIGKTSKKVTKVVRYDAPNIVRHGGVSGFSEEFNIVPIGPHRTRVLLRQRFPKGPVLSALLNVPGVEWGLEYLVREWNYQIGLEDYCVMQGQAHLIDDLGAPNWDFTGMGDDLIIKFWKWCRAASVRDGRASEYEARWDGSEVPAAEVAKVSPIPLAEATHGWGRLAEKQHMRPHYMDSAPVADYPPLNHKGYRAPFEPDSRVVEKMRQTVEDAAERATKLGGSALLGAGLGASVGLTVAASVAFAESFPAL